MDTKLEKLNKIASKKQSEWLIEAKERAANAIWRDKSVKIAIRVLHEIRKQKEINGMTQKKLAEEMGVSPQYINRIVKGNENLTLETITNLEKALNVTLLIVPAISDEND